MQELPTNVRVVVLFLLHRGCSITLYLSLPSVVVMVRTGIVLKALHDPIHPYVCLSTYYWTFIVKET